MSGDHRTVWSASASVNRISPVPSKLIRNECTKYGSFPASMPLAWNQICLFVSSTLSTARTTHSPFVIWFFTLPVTPSYR